MQESLSFRRGELEAYFYQRLEREEPIEDQLVAVLERSSAVASLAVLCELGKKRPELFKGVLQPLLGVAELYEWTLAASIQGRGHMMIGIYDEISARLAHEFHNQEHIMHEQRRPDCWRDRGSSERTKTRANTGSTHRRRFAATERPHGAGCGGPGWNETERRCSVVRARSRLYWF